MALVWASCIAHAACLRIAAVSCTMLPLALALALCLARASTAQEQPACDAPSSAGDAAACEPLREEFLDWLNEGGAKIHPALEIRVSEQSGRRGLNTNAPLDEGTELASVQRKLWLYEAVALESPVGDLRRGHTSGQRGARLPLGCTAGSEIIT